jgi:hypothetical protein
MMLSERLVTEATTIGQDHTSAHFLLSSMCEPLNHQNPYLSLGSTMTETAAIGQDHSSVHVLFSSRWQALDHQHGLVEEKVIDYNHSSVQILLSLMVMILNFQN